MKKNWFYVFLLIAVAVMPLTSCDKEDIPQPEEILKHDPESDADQSTVEAYDALEWLQGCIVLVDNKNEIIRRINGKPLDESQPIFTRHLRRRLLTANCRCISQTPSHRLSSRSSDAIRILSSTTSTSMPSTRQTART